MKLLVAAEVGVGVGVGPVAEVIRRGGTTLGGAGITTGPGAHGLLPRLW